MFIVSYRYNNLIGIKKNVYSQYVDVYRLIPLVSELYQIIGEIFVSVCACVRVRVYCVFALNTYIDMIYNCRVCIINTSCSMNHKNPLWIELTCLPVDFPLMKAGTSGSPTCPCCLK